MLGTSMVGGVVVGHGGKPPGVFSTFFFVLVVFFCGGKGKEKIGNAAFLGGGT